MLLQCFDKNGPPTKMVRGGHFCQISMVLNKIGPPPLQNWPPLPYIDYKLTTNFQDRCLMGYRYAPLILIDSVCICHIETLPICL